MNEVAGQAWVSRAQVEHDAAERFERLAKLVARIHPGSPVIDQLTAAARDERRHLALCAGLGLQLIGHLPERWSRFAPFVPVGLTEREAVLYELVAACCVAETQSMATLTTLATHTRAEASGTHIDEVLRTIARDEVRHAQLGWAHLESEKDSMDVSFLAELLPSMLSGSVDEAFFEPATDPAFEDRGLLALGVLPHSMRRDVFVSALDEIVLPGFRLMGVNDSPARVWLAKHQSARSRPARR